MGIQLLAACTATESQKSLNKELSDSPTTSPTVAIAALPELTPTQSTAFDAFNALQLQSNGHLYSTFVGSVQPCSRPDTTFSLSRTELLLALQQLQSVYGPKHLLESSHKLAAAAVIAQDSYLVEQCYGTSFKMVNDTMRSVPAPGSWILRRVLGRRDVILEWGVKCVGGYLL